MKYLIHNDKVGQWVEVPAGASSDHYGELQTAFEAKHGQYAEMVRFASWEKAGNVFYSESLAGPEGASFRLYQLPGITNAEIAEAKKQLRRERDVVRLTTIKIREYV